MDSKLRIDEILTGGRCDLLQKTACQVFWLKLAGRVFIVCLAKYLTRAHPANMEKIFAQHYRSDPAMLQSVKKKCCKRLILQPFLV